MAAAALVAGTLAPALVGPQAVTAQSTGTTVQSTLSVVPAPDYFRIGWTPSANIDTPISVRDNDEVTLRRCATVGSMEKCVDVTAVCGAVFADMEELFDLLDGLSVDIKASWDSQIAPDGTVPGTPPLYRLPKYGDTSDIGLAEILQASWPLLPLRYMFLNWDMDFSTGVDLTHTATFASTLETEIAAAYSAIARDHNTGAWTVRKESNAAAQLNPANVPRSVVDWITDRGGAGLPFPAFTLGALLDGTTLAVSVDGDAVPATTDAFGTRLNDLTGGKSYNTWGGELQVVDADALADAIGSRLTLDQRRLLEEGNDQAVKNTLKKELADALKLAADISGDSQSEAVPYTVRSALAYLKIFAEHPANEGFGGFRDGRSYAAHQFPFHVLFEAPDLTPGLLELYGLPRPAYRSVRDITFSGGISGVFFEQRAESLLLEMFDYCANELVVSEDRFLRWNDPFSDTSPDYATEARAEASKLTGISGFEIARAPEPAGDADGSVIQLTGNALGEATLWYCYSFGLAGCTEPWTPVTVLVEPDGWNDARIVIQRDHFHIVVDWNSGSVHVLRPSEDSTGGIADLNLELGGDYGVQKIDGSGKWVNDPAARQVMPHDPAGPGWGYEVVSHYCCLTNSSSSWSFQVQLPVIDNDEVHFYRKSERDKPAGPDNELELLPGTVTCDTSRYCQHVQAHELQHRRKLAGPKIDIDAHTAPNGITAKISSRSTAGGATVPLFASAEKHFFEKFWLSYCVSAPNVGCDTWTDRREDNLVNNTLYRQRQGHCVMATSLDLPVAPNAPSLLTLREWARQTGRPQGSFYFRRAIDADGFEKAHLLGWDSREVTHDGITLRNYECPALDPQNPGLAGDWDKVDKRTCQTGKTSYTDAAELEYKAYRRFWKCDNHTPVVSEFTTNRRAGHPTGFTVLVTLEFVNDETNVGPKTPAETLEDDQTLQIGSQVDAECATADPLTDWDTKGDWDVEWNADPADDSQRGQPRDWCVPPEGKFAQDRGCTTTGTPLDGLLLSGHYRWNQIQSARSSSGNEPLPLFPVSAGLQVNRAVAVCNKDQMSIAGVWPTFPPNPNSPRTLSHAPYWPSGACNGVDDDPAYEIDKACGVSYPRLYDSDRGSSNGIQLHPAWENRVCVLAGLGDECSGSPLSDPYAPDPDTFGGCVGEAACRRWVIPEPGFYQVRLLVKPEPKEKPADEAKFPPFVVDKLIWAQSLYTGAG